MAEKDQQSPHPLAPASHHAASSDTESAAAASHGGRELLKKKRTKCLLYVVLFIIFQTAIITLFALTVMKVKTPKFRIGHASVTTFNAGARDNPSLRARLDVQFSVKNTNFGRYKYRNTTVVFKYRGTPVGEVNVPRSRVNWRSTRKFDVEVDLILGNGNMDSELRNDLNTGIVAITSEAKMRGRAELLFVMKKNKSTDMNCYMEIVTGTQQQITNIACK